MTGSNPGNLLTYFYFIGHNSAHGVIKDDIDDQTGQYNWVSILISKIEYCTVVKTNTADCIQGNFNPLEKQPGTFITEIYGKF